MTRRENRNSIDDRRVRAARGVMLVGGVGMLGSGLAAYDWRLALVITGALVALGALRGMARDERG